MKYWKIIARNLKKPDSAWDGSQLSTIMDAQFGSLTRIVTENVLVRADEKLTAFMELEAVIE